MSQFHIQNPNMKFHIKSPSNSSLSMSAIVIDPTTKFTTNYKLAIKYYLHRKFTKSFQLTYPLIKSLLANPSIITSHLKLKIYKLYLSILSLLLHELTTHKITHLSSSMRAVNFPTYLSENNQISSSLLSDFYSGGIYKQVFDLELTDHPDVVLMCFIVESSNGFSLNDLKEQVESYLTQCGVLPTPAMGNLNEELIKVMKFYLSHIILKSESLSSTEELITRLFISDDNLLDEWLNWLHAYVAKSETLAKDNEWEEDDEEINCHEEYDNENDVNFPVSETSLNESNVDNGIIEKIRKKKVKKLKKKPSKPNALILKSPDRNIGFALRWMNGFSKLVGFDIYSKFLKPGMMIMMIITLILSFGSTIKTVKFRRFLLWLYDKINSTLKMALKVSYM